MHPPLYGKWMVTTPVESLKIGDVVSMLWQEPAENVCEVLATGETLKIGLDYIFPLLPRAPMFLNGTNMIEFLTSSAELVPDEGWSQYLTKSGVNTWFTPPSSWQFSAVFWDPSERRCGKTGGLHMSFRKHMRRCQLCIECGVSGESLMGSLPGTKAGVLLYIANMNTATACGVTDVCYETSLSLSFSALLITYVELVSEVRKRVYEHPYHKYSGVHYLCQQWDYDHKPFQKPFPVYTRPGKRCRGLNLFQLAVEKANLWIQAEQAVNGSQWQKKESLLVPLYFYPGQKLVVRVSEVGVVLWMTAEVVDVINGRPLFREEVAKCGEVCIYGQA